MLEKPECPRYEPSGFSARGCILFCLPPRFFAHRQNTPQNSGENVETRQSQCRATVCTHLTFFLHIILQIPAYCQKSEFLLTPPCRRANISLKIYMIEARQASVTGRRGASTPLPVKGYAAEGVPSGWAAPPGLSENIRQTATTQCGALS